MLKVRKMADKRRAVAGKVRRAYLALFRREYIYERLERREGACRGCGRCCELLYRCPFLTRERRCAIYGVARPANCKFFPIDERDLHDVGGKCGFSFSH
jgi:hypothetical protein